MRPPSGRKKGVHYWSYPLTRMALEWSLEIEGLNGRLQELAQQQINIGNARKNCLLVFGYIVIPTMLQFSQNHKIQLWCFEVTVNRTRECEKTLKLMNSL